jgi:hypothetical protein
MRAGFQCINITPYDIPEERYNLIIGAALTGKGGSVIFDQNLGSIALYHFL